MSEDLDKALKLLEKAESDYRESLEELTLASNAVYHGHFICQARFDKVISLRKEVRKETSIGHAFASFVNLTRENEKLKAENKSLKDELSQRVPELTSLSERYDELKEKYDELEDRYEFSWNHSVERGERD